MNSTDISTAVMSFFLYDKKHAFVVPRLMFAGNESDVITINRTGYVHEIEIKISKSDYKVDASKSKWKFYEKAREAKTRTCVAPNYFWYCFPVGLIEDSKIPDKFGILHVNKTKQNIEIKVHREAPRYGKSKADRRLIDQICRSLSFKVLNAQQGKYDV